MKRIITGAKYGGYALLSIVGAYLIFAALSLIYILVGFSQWSSMKVPTGFLQ